MKEGKTKYFVPCAILFGLILAMYISALAGFVYYYIVNPVELQAMFDNYFISFGVTAPDIRQILIVVCVMLSIRIIIAGIYLYRSIRFSRMTKVQFMDKSRRYALDFILLFILGLVPMLVYLVVCESNNLRTYSSAPVDLPSEMSPEVVNAVRTLQAYRDSGRISKEAYEKMIVNMFVEKNNDKK